MPKPPRSKKYLEWIRKQSCVVSWFEDCPVVAHHVRQGSHAGMGQKPSDYWTLPLIQTEHQKLHNDGERDFWAHYNTDPHKDIAFHILRYLEEHDRLMDAVKALESLAVKLDKGE